LLVLIGLIYITYFTYMIMTKKPENKKKTDEEVDDDDVKDVKA
jgi:predicted membrane protein